MNYIKLLNDFWDLLDENPLSSTAQLLYYTLLQINNKCGWAKEFRRANHSIYSKIGVGEKAFVRARNELKQQGLIDFASAKRRGEITQYCILGCRLDPLNDTHSDSHSDTHSDTHSDAQTAVETPDINKLKQKQKLKQKNNTPHISPQPKKEKLPKVQYAEFVSMTNVQYEALIERFGEAKTKGCIEILDNYKGSTGKKYKDDYRTILNWVGERYDERQKNRPGQIPTDYGDFD